MKTSILIASLTLAIGLPTVAMAAPGEITTAPGAPFQVSFMTLDTNKNGTTNQTEILNGQDHVIVKEVAEEGRWGWSYGTGNHLSSTTGQTYIPADRTDCTASAPCTSAIFTPNGKIETKGTSVILSQDPKTGNVIATVKAGSETAQLPVRQVGIMR